MKDSQRKAIHANKEKYSDLSLSDRIEITKKDTAEFDEWMRESKQRTDELIQRLDKSEIKRHEETLEDIKNNWNSEYQVDYGTCFCNTVKSGRCSRCRSKSSKKAYAEKRLKELRGND